MKGNVHIVIIGKEGVGKTALVVRYLTGRYLTEYAHAREMTYERTVVVEDKTVPLKITDISRTHKELKSKEFPSKVDGVIVVYAVNDKSSFDFAEVVCDWIKKERKQTAHVPVVLLGNKADLNHIRCVACQKSGELNWHSDCYLVTECSASTDKDEITEVFNALINKVLEKRETSLRPPRRLSQNPLGSPKIIRATLKRRFSVFTRERTSTM